MNVKPDTTSINPLWSRREALSSLVGGFSGMALWELLSRKNLLQAKANEAKNPLVEKPVHFAPKAKRVILIFMHGGPSQVDTFDYKPELQKRHGQPLPFAKPKVVFAKTGNLGRSPFKFQRYGRSGAWVSELFHEVGEVVDELCFLKGIHGSNSAHGGACMMLQTGSPNFVRPSMGSWVTYGLGTENDNLPGFITIDPRAHCGHRNWSSAFLPASYQGTPVRNFRIQDLKAADQVSKEEKARLDLLKGLNTIDFEEEGGVGELAAQIANFELAAKMQLEAPEILDLSEETRKTEDLYGIHDSKTSKFGRQCLLARRFAERGVRFIQVSHGYWDSHGNLKKEHQKLAKEVDRPIAGLITDLRQRGLLDDTLVIWGGEFGRTPCVQGNVNSEKAGRDHNPHGYTMWMAGGGVKPGFSFGGTDDFGWYAESGKVHLHDFHATLLHLLGLDHEKLTYHYEGRDFRLTDVFGRVVDEIIS